MFLSTFEFLLILYMILYMILQMSVTCLLSCVIATTVIVIKFYKKLRKNISQQSLRGQSSYTPLDCFLLFTECAGSHKYQVFQWVLHYELFDCYSNDFYT